MTGAVVLRSLVVFILSITLPISQVYGIVPSGDSIFNDIVESGGEETAVVIPAPSSEENTATAVPLVDLLPSEALIPSEILNDQSSQIEEIEEAADESLIVPDQDQPFWTGKKIVVTTSLLLTTGLIVGLLLLLAGGGGGSGSGSGAGGGGGGAGTIDDVLTPPVIVGGPDPPIDLPPIDLPPIDPLNPPIDPLNHSPEPSTFLLLGLGLLVPLLRKRSA